jgi:Cd2+/Zn2+-exporting ATPase/Cu+-exporting ATPase
MPDAQPGSESATLEVPIAGMDCADCTRHVQHAIAALPGVATVEVFLGSEKAVVRLDPARVGLEELRGAVQAAGYSVPVLPAGTSPDRAQPPAPAAASYVALARRLGVLLGLAFGLVLLVVVVGEWFGLLDRLTERVPFSVGLASVLIAGWPIFRQVLRAAWRRQVIAHSLMSVGVLAALAVGQWATAAVVVLFMHVGNLAERFTTQRSRRALQDLARLAPQTARVLRGGAEVELPISQVQPGDLVVVRPGEAIPVDGEVVEGQATIDQAALTGEPLPQEVGPGARVLAASLARLGSIRVRASRVGAETTFGQVIQLVETAEANRAGVQRVADAFSAWYLPVVAGIAALTFLLRRDPLATAAVLVVACSCSFALATPIAMLAAIGAGARRGVLVKGAKYLELLARADVLLVDKTGTLTLGRPQLTDVVPLNGWTEDAVLRLAATAERYSEHPLAEAVRVAALDRGLPIGQPDHFAALPGEGVRAQVGAQQITVGHARTWAATVEAHLAEAAVALERFGAEGKSLMVVASDGEPVGVLAVADTLRPEVPAALAAVRRAGVRHIELLTGDNRRAAGALAAQLGVGYRAELLPADKIAVVREYQARGHTVVMVGDGVNDAPALAQADVGLAMGATGTDLALEAAHVILLRDDWHLVPGLLNLARRTLRVVRLNIAFTAVYNLAGLSLAALGWLPPIFAAAAQSLPDLGILANSSRLLRHRL